ncbi:MAG: aspartyl-phosphate phosphatase Spo0E family protein [Thermotaleaceae bacterium]
MNKYDIEQLRSVLNDLIIAGHDYEEIYRVSIELDQLIVEYYKENDYLSAV